MPREYSGGYVESADITYSDAISSSNHSGESMIAKELREQREREEELRKHWESLGFSVNTQEPPDTPYNMPEPRQPPPIKSLSVPMGLSTQTSQRNMTMKDLKYNMTAELRTVNQGSRRASTDSASSKNTDQSQVVDKTRVQPYSEDSDDEENDYMNKFLPLTETPVEREIRLAREREEALRREKGLPPTEAMFTNNSEVVLEVRGGGHSSRPSSAVYRRGLSEDEHGTMKRFASSRLQQEIEKEKRREMDLKTSGTIYSVSEERVGPSTKYVDIISETPPASQQPVVYRQKTVTNTTVTTPTTNGSLSPNGAPAKRYSGDYNVKVRGTPSGAESMIEREIRELKEREKELR
jgi:hypothetical protein